MTPRRLPRASDVRRVQAHRLRSGCLVVVGGVASCRPSRRRVAAGARHAADGAGVTYGAGRVGAVCDAPGTRVAGLARTPSGVPVGDRVPALQRAQVVHDVPAVRSSMRLYDGMSRGRCGSCRRCSRRCGLGAVDPAHDGDRRECRTSSPAPSPMPRVAVADRAVDLIVTCGRCAATPRQPAPDSRSPPSSRSSPAALARDHTRTPARRVPSIGTESCGLPRMADRVVRRSPTDRSSAAA